MGITSVSCRNQTSAHQKSKPSGGCGKQEEVACLGQCPQSKSVSTSSRTITKQEEKQEMLPVASHSWAVREEPARAPPAAVPLALCTGCRPTTPKPSPGAPPGWQKKAALSTRPMSVPDPV